MQGPTRIKIDKTLKLQMPFKQRLVENLHQSPYSMQMTLRGGHTSQLSFNKVMTETA